ncbi:hypothetical protein ACWEJ6_50960 [Nonomuraea sp. NPDC004702]
MTDLSQIWICGSMSEVIRADHLTGLFVSDGAPDNRAGESNTRGVLWAHAAGRAEPVRIDGFVGITAAEIIDAMTRAIADLVHASQEPVAYIRLHSSGGRMPVSSVKVSKSFPVA